MTSYLSVNSCHYLRSKTYECTSVAVSVSGSMFSPKFDWILNSYARVAVGIAVAVVTIWLRVSLQMVVTEDEVRQSGPCTRTICVCVCVRAVNFRQPRPNKAKSTPLNDGVEVHGTDAELDKHPTSDIHSR